MLWAFGVPMAERWDGLKSLFSFWSSRCDVSVPALQRAPWVMNGFLLSCGALLIFRGF